MAKDDYAGTNGRNYKIRKRLFFFILHSILHRLLNFAPVNFKIATSPFGLLAMTKSLEPQQKNDVQQQTSHVILRRDEVPT